MEPVVIIGAGPAGLATAYQLSRLDVPYRLVDAGDAIASSWRRRHPQLRLNTLRMFSHQPGLRIPRRFGRWVARDDYVRYLEEYARRFDLAVELGTTLLSLTRLAEGWALETSRGGIEARHVVVCTGLNRVRCMPTIPGLESFPGIVRHAEEFGRAEEYEGLRVLVVGGGNSAFDIASHLADRPVSELVMSIRRPASVLPKEAFGLPLHLLAVLGRPLPLSIQDRIARLLRRVLLGDLSSLGLADAPEGAFTRHARDGVTIALDDGFLRAVSRGRARIVPEIVRVDRERVLTRDGEELRPDVILCATGYTTGLEPLLGQFGALDAYGFPTTIAAEPNPDLPGLWFLGVRGYIWGNMNEQRRQSRRLARAIAADYRNVK